MQCQTKIPTCKLVNGKEMPVLGIGTSRTANETPDLEKALKYALSIGYKHIDTAWIYFNDTVINKVLKECCQGSGLGSSGQTFKREDLFIACKLWNTFHKKELVSQGLTQSLKNYGLDYLDAYYIHWPTGFQENTGNDPYPKDDKGQIIFSDVDYIETYKAIEDCCNNGMVKCIGLSNFNQSQVENVLKNCKIRPAVIQLEVHPYFQNEKLVEFCQNNGIIVVAYAPLGCVEVAEQRPELPNLLEDETLIKIGKKYNKTAAQVALRWSVQRGCAPIPKAIDPKQICENAQIFDFELNQEDMLEIKKLDRNCRVFTMSELKGHKYYPFNE